MRITMGPQVFAPQGTAWFECRNQHRRRDSQSYRMFQSPLRRLISVSSWLDGGAAIYFEVMSLPLLASQTLIGQGGTPSQQRPQPALQHNFEWPSVAFQ